ncbi:MAG: leucine-rich repeat protein [Treponema sp.]|uniref:leucine-rich repeat domain-containing protein n=1 Tax=Treponema sp. TaxID=166 RepID=UPI0025D1AAB2|nr:leucine-rich repeat domain-containing protein [Treponema sp.]MBQ9280625.1 leucine-rich repeat protein [Treponema sp.]
MIFTDPNFIIKTFTSKKTGSKKHVLRRYKGNEPVVTIPDGVNKIADFTFADDIEPNTTIEKIIIPDSVTEITANAFSYCKALKDIKFPNKLKEFVIDFKHCPAIEEIVVPESVTDISACCFTTKCKSIRVGGNITFVNLTFFGKNKKVMTLKPKFLADVLLSNPAYTVIDGFVVNKIHQVSLFRLHFDKAELRLPEEIKVIGTNTFYEFYRQTSLSSDMVSLEKVIIPASVRKINHLAFMNCESLKEVIYEGFSEDLEVSKWAFYMCAGFHHDGREIVCKDSPKQTTRKGKTSSWDMVRRIIIIDDMIRMKSFPKLTDFLDVCMENVTSASIPSLYRDISMMRVDLCAPIEYDTFKKGYYYSSPFTLDFRRLRLW